MPKTKTPQVAVHPDSVLHYTNRTLPVDLISILSDAKIASYGDRYCLDFPQASKEVYEAFKPLLVVLRGEWNGKTHVFAYDPTDLLQVVLQVGKYPKANPYALFETPECAIADLCVIADIPESEVELKILEPEAGRGAIARFLRKRLPKSSIDCIEVDPINRKILQEQGFNLIGTDFLETAIAEEYDLIVMNPPFQGEVFVDHIMKAYSHLRVGGLMGAIAPADPIIRASTPRMLNLRNLVASQGYFESIGSPFKGTKTECLGLKIEKFSDKYLASKWEPTENGYDSVYEYRLHEVLSSDRRYYDAVNRAKELDEGKRVQYIGDAVDAIVQQMIAGKDYQYYTDKKGRTTRSARMIDVGYTCLYYDDRVKEQIIKTAIESDMVD